MEFQITFMENEKQGLMAVANKFLDTSEKFSDTSYKFSDASEKFSDTSLKSLEWNNRIKLPTIN